MHANLKGLHGVKGLLLRHCEKIGVFAVAVCAIIFVWKSLGRETLPSNYQPNELESLVTRTGKKIREFRKDHVPATEKREVVRLTAGANRAVHTEHYQTSPSGLNRAVVAPTVHRTDPVLLTAQDLEVHSGAGLLAFADEEIRRQRELERAKEQARRAKEREEEQQRQRDEAQRGRGRGEEGFGGFERGMEMEMGMGRGRMAVDPEHPNRRQIEARIRPEGVPLRGDERIDEDHWAVVVAKVPVEDQLKLYKDALDNTRQYNPSGDCPEYVGYYVERAEVRHGQMPEFQKLYTGTTKRIDEEIKDWAQFPPEVIDGLYYNPVLTYPLPPLVGRDWQYDVTHSEIPLAVDVVRDVEPDLALEEDEETPADGEPQFLAESNSPRRGQLGMMGRGSRFGGEMDEGGRGFGGGYGEMMGGFEGGFGEMDEGGMGFEGGYGDMMGGYGEMMGGFGEMMGEGYGGMGAETGGRSGMAGRRGRRSTANAICMADVPYHLFRFFDFTVQPGKTYKYRVRLVLMDVNHQVSKSALDNAVVERLAKRDAKAQPIRLTEWSQPSPPVSIPIAGSVRVASAEGAADGSFNPEPKVTLLVQAFDVREGNQAVQTGKEMNLYRGSVANVKDDAEYIVGTRYIDKIDDFVFVTDITVVDIDGGDKLSRDLSEPARALLMDATGRLFIRDELTDREDVEYHKKIFAQDKRRRRGARGMDESDMRGGEFFEGGF